MIHEFIETNHPTIPLMKLFICKKHKASARTKKKAKRPFFKTSDNKRNWTSSIGVKPFCSSFTSSLHLIHSPSDSLPLLLFFTSWKTVVLGQEIWMKLKILKDILLLQQPCLTSQQH